MPVRYRITRESEHSLTRFDDVTLARADSAQRALERLVYDMIAANGLLDRQCGHDLMDKARAANMRAPDLGHAIDWTFRLNGQCVRACAYR